MFKTTLYITRNGFLNVVNAFDEYYDIDSPWDRTFFSYVFLNDSFSKNKSLEFYKDLIFNKNNQYFYFAISKDTHGKYFLDKRTNGNFCVIYSSKNISDYKYIYQCPKNINNEEQLYKFLKKEALNLVKDLNLFENNEVYNYHLYSFTGEVEDCYFGLIGKLEKSYIEDLFCTKIKKTLNINCIFEEISNCIYIDDKITLDYIINTYKTNDFQELLEVFFNEKTEIFLKENILHELFEFASKNEFMQKEWNDMFMNIFEKQLNKYLV